MAKHIQDRIKTMMRARALVLEALQEQPDTAFSLSDPDNITIDEEKVISTYVLALMTEDVATATYQMGPT